MKNWLARTGLVYLAFSSAAMAGEAAPGAGTAAATFVQKPTAVKDGNKITIQFAVDRQTDVAIYVEDAKGRIVRHLVAGALGKNPPEPLKANSLEQSVEWDGCDDDGKPVAGGSVSFRVGLGLKATYAGLPFAEKGQTGPNRIDNIIGLTTGPDGRLYVLDNWYWGEHWICPRYTSSFVMARTRRPSSLFLRICRWNEPGWPELSLIPSVHSTRSSTGLRVFHSIHMRTCRISRQ